MIFHLGRTRRNEKPVSICPPPWELYKMPICLIQKHIAQLSIGASTLRGQGRGAARTARDYLGTLPLDTFVAGDRAHFRRALNKHTKRLAGMLPSPPGRRPPCGVNWGAARKALNIFLRNALYNVHLCQCYGLEKMENWLEVPLDNDAAKCIRRTPPAPRGWTAIKGLTPAVSRAYQRAAARIAKACGIARVHLDLRWFRENQGPDRECQRAHMGACICQLRKDEEM